MTSHNRSPGSSDGTEFHGIIGESAAIRDLKKRILEVAKSNRPCLITGETGTGKELTARAIHAESRRGPFEAVNCAGLGRELIESELFGYITGAFTGADEDREGFFVAADGGTLFLDEIAEMPLDVQANLLRTVETDVVRPVGGTSKHSRKVDVRIIAATNQDLPRQNHRNLRKDLFFRLAVHQFGITPLRERKEDIPLLCEHILSGRAIISKEVEELFMGYHWPGNVRELESVLEDALTRAGDGVFRKDRLSSDLKVRKKKRASPAHPIDKDYADYAAFTHQRRILDEENGNIARAASRLGITRPTLRRRNKRWEGLGYPAIEQDVDSISDEDGGSSSVNSNQST